MLIVCVNVEDDVLDVFVVMRCDVVVWEGVDVGDDECVIGWVLIGLFLSDDDDDVCGLMVVVMVVMEWDMCVLVSGVMVGW